MPRDIEDAYRRFQDFGLVAGLMLSTFCLGLVARQIVLGNHTLETVVKIIACSLLAAHLIPLIICALAGAPSDWMEKRTLRETAVAMIIVIAIGVIFAGILIAL